MRVLEDKKEMNITQKKKKNKSKGKSKRVGVVKDLLRLGKTIDTIHSQITALSSDLNRLESEYKYNLRELLSSGEFYISVSNLASVLGDEFDKYLSLLLNFVEHVHSLKDKESGFDAYVYVKDGNTIVVYFDKDAIPDEIRDEVSEKRVVVW